MSEGYLRGLGMHATLEVGDCFSSVVENREIADDG